MNLIKKHAIKLYFFFVFFISWCVVALMAGLGNIPINYDRILVPIPVLYSAILLGPSVSGLIMIAFVDGKTGMLNLQTRLFNFKVGFKWYVLAIFATPLLSMVILTFLSTQSSDYYIAVFQSTQPMGLIMSGLFSGIMVGVFEEIGWSGFVIPQMKKRYNNWQTGLYVGIIWGAWHFILFLESGSFTGVLPLMILLGRLFAWLPPYRILMVRLYSHTESLPIVMLCHASLVFTVTTLVPMTLKGASLLIWLITWSAVLWLVIVIRRKKGDLCIKE